MLARERFRSSTPRAKKMFNREVAKLAVANANIGCKVTLLAAGDGRRYNLLLRGALAQLVRALPCHGRGCGFEPRRLRGLYYKNYSLGRSTRAQNSSAP